MSKKKEGGSKKAKKSTSNVFSLFDQNQIAEFKEAFGFMDHNKDGVVDKNDLRMTYDALGRIVPDNELDAMLAEAPGPLNFTMFLTIFGERVQGTDPEDAILNAFKSFDLQNTGKVDVNNLRKFLAKWGEKLTDAEMDEAFAEANVEDDGLFDVKAFTKVLAGTKEEAAA